MDFENRKVIKKTFEYNGVNVTLETGLLAQQSQAAVIATMGETTVLSVVVVAKEPVVGVDFFPLTVNYVVKHYASGKISSSRFMKREGRETDDEILNARLLDHAIRSLFPDDFTYELQVISTVLSYDKKNDPAILSMISSSAALLISGVPFKEAVGSSRVGLIDGKLCINPKTEEMDHSSLDLVVSSISKGIVSIEAEGREIPEDKLIEALNFAHIENQKLIEFQNEFVKEAGVKEYTYTPYTLNTEVLKICEDEISSSIETMTYGGSKEQRDNYVKAFKKSMVEKYLDKYSSDEISKAVEKILKKHVRSEVLKSHRRIDGRQIDEVRPLNMAVGLIPRVHGSALFERGETQTVSIVTLGSSRVEQTLDGIEGEEVKRYMHHYNMPGYASGEVDRKLGLPNRRSIGHGAIGEKGLLPVLPSQDQFPYTIRVVSEVMASNGSTSMASTCGSSLALMDAGVPISSPVGGIGVGLIYESEDKYIILTDIIGTEDFYGDMDFKITGTEKGMTAIQLDNKLKGIPVKILEEAIFKSRNGRLHVLSQMNKVLSEPRSDLSQFAPRITKVKINQSKIGELIGPGGKVIKEIIAKTGVDIDIQDDGTVLISSVEASSAQEALRYIDEIVGEVEVGKIYEAKVARIEAFGAFVDVSPSIGGLVHVSELADGFVKDPNEVVRVGQIVKVKAMAVDDRGRINFSIKKASIKPTVESSSKDNI